jgi:nucleoside phosphorylase
MTQQKDENDKADYAIVTALQDELEALLALANDHEVVSGGSSDIRYYYRLKIRCDDGSDQVVVCACANAMGQLAASNLTRDIIQAWAPRHVLLVGIAGGVAERGARFGDVIVPHVVHYYEPSKLRDGSVEDRSRRYLADTRLETTAQMMALEASSSPDWVSSIGVARPDGSDAIPGLHLTELASGEQVWASLEAEDVQRVLNRYLKVNGVETEAAGVFDAAREAPRRPDVLVVKAFQDLIVEKNDDWREYAARASASFALALIKRLGARWKEHATGEQEALLPSTTLPVPHTAFIGRQSDLDDLSQLLTPGAETFVTLTGPGGVGKTRVALAVASRLLPQYPGGVFFCELAEANDEATALSALSVAVGTPSTSELEAQLRRLVANGPVLLVLDTFEPAISATRTIANLVLGVRGLSTIVTSRERLRVSGELVRLLEPLSLPPLVGDLSMDEIAAFDSVALFVTRARRVERDWQLDPGNAHHVAQV